MEFLSKELPRRSYCCFVLRANSNDKGGDSGGGSSKKGYRFGDLTKSLLGGSVEKVRYSISRK